jgi:hypothetical protein
MTPVIARSGRTGSLLPFPAAATRPRRAAADQAGSSSSPETEEPDRRGLRRPPGINPPQVRAPAGEPGRQIRAFRNLAVQHAVAAALVSVRKLAGQDLAGHGRPTRRPKTNFSVGCVGSVVVPSWAEPASLVTAGIAKYWKVIVVSPGNQPGSTSKIE